MTPEPPKPEMRRSRPGVAARGRALGIEVTPGAAKPSAPATRESLADALARIPDMSGSTPTVGGSTVAIEAKPAGKAAPTGKPSTASSDGTPTPAGPALLAPAKPPSEAPDPTPSETGDAKEAKPDSTADEKRRPSALRRTAFVAAVVLLVAAIPALTYTGSQVIKDSTAGDFKGPALTPSEPGFEAQVNATPTAVAIQYDDEGMPNGATFLTLDSEEGGTVIFMPLDTEVANPSLGVNRLRNSYSIIADRPAKAREQLAGQVGRLLNVGIEDIIDLNTTDWTQLVEPVAPLTIENPDDVTLADGTVVPSGTVELEAAQVGPYLAAEIPGESDLNRMGRHEVVWRAWIDAMATSGSEISLPGEDSAGINRFITGLVSGPVNFVTLPVESTDEGPALFRIDEDAVNDLIDDAVASPTSAGPGSRFSVRLLNGVSANAIPSELVGDIVGNGGSVTVLGNGPEFGTAKTTVVYADPANEGLAEVIAAAIGATGSVKLNREAPDTVDLTIVLGKDILGDSATSGDAGSTTPETISDAGGN